MADKGAKVKLEPVDKRRCQAEISFYHPFVTGGTVRGFERCSQVPIYIAKEVTPGPDGQRGAMSLCAGCQAALVKQFTERGKPLPTFVPIRQKK